MSWEATYLLDVLRSHILGLKNLWKYIILYVFLPCFILIIMMGWILYIYLLYSPLLSFCVYDLQINIYSFIKGRKLLLHQVSLSLLWIMLMQCWTKSFSLTAPNIYFSLDTDMVIIYLSAGITTRDSSEDGKKTTLRVINEENSFLNNSVMILTYALMNGKGWLPYF